MQKKWPWYLILIFFLMIVFVRIYDLNVFHHANYETDYEKKTELTILGPSAPRGRILDVNGVVLVDNTLSLDIVYRKIDQPTFEEEEHVAEELASILPVSQPSVSEQKAYYMQKYPDVVHDLITEEEWDLYAMRKLTDEEICNLQKERITASMLEKLSDSDFQVAMIYALMNRGYSYQNKVLLQDASDEVVARVSELHLPGVMIFQNWKRSYPYGELLRSIFGSVARLPFEEKDAYLDAGYALDDVVGVSFLEKEYESYLRGEKAVYMVLDDKSLSLISEAKRGNDLYLSIDIRLQQKLDELLKSTMLQVKKYANTDFFEESYAIIGDPTTGAIRAIVGEQFLEHGFSPSFKEVTANTLQSSFTPGSVVKGASHTVGYLYDAIDPNQKILDGCVKLYLTPEKCSYKRLGYLDDILALKWSSNYYQFMTAIRVMGLTYSYNMQLHATAEVFSKYRDVFQNYGLGSKTGIDLPHEQTGVQGSIISDDLLLNLTIGQYDTYTPLQLLQYINTISQNGVRYKLSFMDRIVSFSGEEVFKHQPEVLSTISLDSSYYDRIHEGFREVLESGTGSGYVSPSLGAYGKTGTSESFLDANGDGVIDTNTITSTLAMIGPSNDTLYSLVVVAPHISHFLSSRDYTAPFARFISKEMSEYLFHYES